MKVQNSILFSAVQCSALPGKAASLLFSGILHSQ